MSADPTPPARTAPPPRTRAAPRQSTTHCPYCALQCSTVLAGEAGGVTVTPSPDFPVNQGGLCQKGWTAPAVLGALDRLRTPGARQGR